MGHSRLAEDRMVRDPAFELETLAPDEPMPGVVAVHALYGLGLDDHHCQTGWRKLAGRPVGRVRELLAKLEGERPELIQTRLTEFAKTHKAQEKI